jgi:Phage tail protein
MPTLAQALTFQYTNTGVILNTDNSHVLPFIDVQKVSGLDNAPIRLSQADHEGTDGGYVDSQFETTRVITISGMVYCVPGSEEGYLDQLKANYAPSTVVQPFYFSTPDQGTRCCFGKSQGLNYDWDTSRRTGMFAFQIVILCPDPVIYGISSSTISATLTSAATGGRAYNRLYPLSYGGGGTTNAFVCVNNGNRNAPVVFDIFGAVTNPVLYNDTTFQTMTFLTTIAGGHFLRVDCGNKLVLLDAGSSQRSSLVGTPNWIYLAPGNNTIRFLGTQSPPTPVATINAYFQDAWR